jgi:hypothetical protein
LTLPEAVCLKEEVRIIFNFIYSPAGFVNAPTHIRVHANARSQGRE